MSLKRNPQQERQQAHELLDMLPDEKLNAVRTLLEVMVEPLSRSLARAAVEEEELTPETAAALERARASLASYKVPSAVVFDLGPFPRNATGKIDKAKLRAAYLERLTEFA